ncbi:hypothetical protein AUP68_16672 [Ilyonectria robusta]
MSGGTAARLLLYPIKFRPSIVKLFGTGKPCDNAKTQQILPAVLDIVDRALGPTQRVFLSNRMGTGKTKTYLGAIHMYNEFRMDSFLDPPVANNQHVYHGRLTWADDSNESLPANWPKDATWPTNFSFSKEPAVPTRQDTFNPLRLNQQKGMRNHAYAEERDALEIYSQRVRRRCLPIIPRYSAFARLEQARQRMGEKGSSNYLRVFATVHVSRAIRACRLRCNLDRKANHFVFTIWVHHPHSWNPTCILRFPDLYKKGAERRAKMVWGGERAAVSCRQTFLANDPKDFDQVASYRGSSRRFGDLPATGQPFDTSPTFATTRRKLPKFFTFSKDDLLILSKSHKTQPETEAAYRGVDRFPQHLRRHDTSLPKRTSTINLPVEYLVVVCGEPSLDRKPPLPRPLSTPGSTASASFYS